jgi:tRNA-(ms[2]io[6]A)-hydroxylase
LPDALGRFYAGLLASEARHFDNYLDFARKESGAHTQDFDARLAELKLAEASLICEADTQFRFHSGPPGGRA